MRRRATYLGLAVGLAVAAIAAVVFFGLPESGGSKKESSPVVWTNLNCRQMDLGIQGAVVSDCRVNDDGTITGTFDFPR